MAKHSEQTTIEWTGGVVSMPTYVAGGEGEPYRPEALFWIGANGAVLGHAVGKPGEVFDLASHSLRETMKRPMWGQPHAPTRVRVASPELAVALRTEHPLLDVVCAPTPEIDRVLAAMLERMGEDREAEKSHLTPDIGPEAIGAFFRAAAGLYRAKPWEVVPDDSSLFSLTIEELGIRDAAVSVIGQQGESFGLVVFSGIEDFEALVDAAEAIEHGKEPRMPPQFTINFGRRSELASKLCEEIEEHRWEVAAPDAYPWFFFVDEDMVERPSTLKDVTMAEAIALAFTEVLQEKGALSAAWQGGEPFIRTLSVRTHAGELDVSLRTPYENELRPLADVFAGLQALGELDEDTDPIEQARLENELVRHFLASPEAKGLTAAQSCDFTMRLASDYFGATLVTLEPRELSEIIFELIPRKLSIEASAARSIIEETRALYAFLKREFALPQADACLDALGGDAVGVLEAALSDSSNFGMAKSLFMKGLEAGFDMKSKAGIDAAMRAMQTGLLSASIRPPAVGAARGPNKAQAKEKKQQRKATRKARRRNR